MRSNGFNACVERVGWSGSTKRSGKGRYGNLMTFQAWFTYAALHLAVCLVPGPMSLFVIAEGMAGGWRRSLSTIGGILMANASYLILSAAGAGVLLSTSTSLFAGLRWAGAAYMFWLAWGFLRSSPETIDGSQSEAAMRSVAKGIAIQLSNPGALIFFLAILPQFIDPGYPLLRQLLILGITSILIEALVLVGLGAGASNIAKMSLQKRTLRRVNQVAALLLIVAAIWSLTVR